MKALRARLIVFAIALLVCQGSVLMAVPAVLCHGAASAAADDVDECCKHLAPGQTCPMHHKSGGSTERRGPAWTCVCSPSDVVLLALIGVSGTLPPAVGVAQPPARLEVVAPAAASMRSRFQPPQYPPPRA